MSSEQQPSRTPEQMVISHLRRHAVAEAALQHARKDEAQQRRELMMASQEAAGCRLTILGCPPQYPLRVVPTILGRAKHVQWGTEVDRFRPGEASALPSDYYDYNLLRATEIGWHIGTLLLEDVTRENRRDFLGYSLSYGALENAHIRFLPIERDTQ